MITDEALVQRAQEGDTGALNALLDRYNPKVYNFAYRMIGNHPDAADAAQEALVKVYLHLRRFRGESAFSTWLYRLVVNTCRDELRRRSRISTESLDAPYETETGNLEREMKAVEDGPEELVQRLEVSYAVHRAIGKLREDYRALIVLRDLQDLSYREIGEVTGLTVGTIKSRLHRARLAFRSLLRGEGDPRQEQQPA